MAVNPNGYVPISDGGAPRIITGYAKEVISGGQFIGGSTAAGVVGSGRDSFVASDLEFVQAESGKDFFGIALADAASGAELAVATRGTFLVPASGTGVILAGNKVGANAASELILLGSQSDPTVVSLGTIGRALTAGSGGDFVVFEIGY
jgi:hypothetical protein